MAEDEHDFTANLGGFLLIALFLVGFGLGWGLFLGAVYL